jgi:hypothetical protein
MMWNHFEPFWPRTTNDDDNNNNKYSSLSNNKAYVDARDVSRLLRGFRKGSIAGIITVGKTWKTTNAERQQATLQRQVQAPFEGIGRFCTEITAAQWLKRPIP